MTANQPARSRPGRKRNPEIEGQVFEAAVTVYARDGWAGFTFESVAREAKVGKPALYRRWEDAEHLLIATFDVGRTAVPTARDCGSLREDLIDFALQFVSLYQNDIWPRITNQLTLDRQRNSELERLYMTIVSRPRVEASRQIIGRAISRGEIAEENQSLVAIELVLGAMSVHWSTTSERARPRIVDGFPAYIENVIDIVLRGVTNHDGVVPGVTESPVEAGSTETTSVPVQIAKTGDASTAVAEGETTKSDEKPTNTARSDIARLNRRRRGRLRRQ